MNKSKHTFTVEELTDFLRKEEENETIEGRLIRRKLIRELYKQLGDPTEEDFGKEMEPAGTYFYRVDGYTTFINIMTEREMERRNNESTDWQIKRPSDIKRRIVNEYEENGWHCRVQAFNVICTKYVKHPRYKDIWVFFYASKDCNKYEYAIVRNKDE